LGMAFTTGIANVAAWSAGFGKSGDVGGLLSAVVSPLGGFGKFLLLLLALSIVANNIPNDYSLGLSVQVFGKAFQQVKRYVWTLIGAVIYIVIAVIGSANFTATLSSFLLDVAYWLGAYAIILVLEHFVFRRGQYNVDDWNTASKLPLGWAAIVALAAGLVGALLGADQLNFQGFITRHINQPLGIDLGFELSVLLAGVVYLILRTIEIRTTPRGEAAAGGK
ncbi:MAG TPA: hypothetical protein VGT44_22880, partial [Ktedonobacteraceae bacterium]|nr:hypothetical protein [Ktedonobacteraceae bacterium]